MIELQRGDSRRAREEEKHWGEGELERLSVRQKERARERLADRLTESSRERERRKKSEIFPQLSVRV